MNARRRRIDPGARPAILSGVPDVIAYHKGSEQVAFVECKRPGEPLRAQSSWLDAALGAAHSLPVLSVDQVAVAVSHFDAVGRVSAQPRAASRSVRQIPAFGEEAPTTVNQQDPAMRTSEIYRSHTIYYSPSMRRWLVEVTSGAGLVGFNSAFQARRAINLALDGESASWPKREDR